MLVVCAMLPLKGGVLNELMGIWGCWLESRLVWVGYCNFSIFYFIIKSFLGKLCIFCGFLQFKSQVDKMIQYAPGRWRCISEVLAGIKNHKLIFKSVCVVGKLSEEGNLWWLIWAIFSFSSHQTIRVAVTASVINVSRTWLRKYVQVCVDWICKRF